MRRLAVAATIAALTLIGGSASATTYLYAFTATGSDPSMAALTGQFTGVFDYDDYKAAFNYGSTFDVALSLTPQPAGAIPAAVFSCSTSVNDGGTITTPACSAPTLYFDDNNGVSEHDLISFGTTDYVYSGVYYFAKGDLTKVGTHQADASLTGYAATLVVTSVPEPSAWALMITGVGLAGLSLRAQRRRPATARA